MGVKMKVLNETLLINLLEYIKKYQAEQGKSPSYRTIMKAMHFSNLATVFRYVNKLQSNDLVKKDNLGGIEISCKLNPGRTILAPLLGTVPCWKPILAIENIEGNYSLPSDIFGTGETFLLHAKGESMINAGIRDKDIIVVRKTNQADDGDIVVALIEDEATVKKLFRKNNKIILHPENPDFEDIVLDEVRILGKVISFIHNF